MTRIGQYEVIKRIGEGGFGHVYQAEHVLLGEKACIKQNKNQSKEDADMLKAEARLLWNLSDYHSIPASKDLIQVSENELVMVMGFIDGQTLEDIVKEKGPVHPEDASWMIERLLGALRYCYCEGVVHSDVKPQNVFIEARKHDIKLIDFGLAAYKPNGRSRAKGYTKKFAAPELMLGTPPIPETDLYGAGMCVLYAMGGDIDKKAFPKSVPKELAEFWDRLLRRDPVQRPKWEDEDLIQTLSDIRQKVFGRRHMSGK